jgi:hypothetical protein
MEIHHWEDAPAGGSIIGTFTVYLPALGLSIHRVKAMRSKKGYTFIAFPSYSKEDEYGQKKWFPYISLSEQRSKDFNKECLRLIQPFMGIKDAMDTHESAGMF